MRKIGVGTVKISSKAKKYVNIALKNHRLSYGPFLQRFENEFARLHDRKFGISCNSGTSALQIALGALKEAHYWNDGDEIIVPAVTFIATSNVVLQNRMQPIFVDVDSKTCNIDSKKIEAKITKKTRAIMPVHLYGLSAEMEPIMKIARKHNLKVLEDSCESMFVSYKGKPVGSLGDIACFSTYAAHLVVTGVGGLALTNNPDYAVIMKSMMNHGRDSVYLNIDDDDNLKNEKAIFTMADKRFSFVRMGYSFRLTELEGALGVAELEDHEKNISSRQRNAAYLIKNLSQYSNLIQLPSWPAYSEHAFMMFPIIVKDPRITRADLITYLEKNGVETRYLMPLLSQPFKIKLLGNIENEYPVAKWVTSNGFYVGCHQNLTKEDLKYLVKVFEGFLSKYVGSEA